MEGSFSFKPIACQILILFATVTCLVTSFRLHLNFSDDMYRDSYNVKWCEASFFYSNLQMSKPWYHRSLSWCGHLDFTPFQLIVTKLWQEEIIFWCHVCVMTVNIYYCYGLRERDQDADSMIKFYCAIHIHLEFCTCVHCLLRNFAKACP